MSTNPFDDLFHLLGAPARLFGAALGREARRGMRPQPQREAAPDAQQAPAPRATYEKHPMEPDFDTLRRSGAAGAHGDAGFTPQTLTVRITRRAWTAILSETLVKVESETGGILLGYRDGEVWTVVEAIDPGPKSVFEYAFFSYDQPYVNHLANRIVQLYERPLEVVGLWHRHPGSFDRFSDTDDGTNARYAQLSPLGALSGLVNVDPAPRFSLFHVDHRTGGYTRVPFAVLDWPESLAAAPLRSPEDLARTIEARNGRATGAGTVTVTVAEPDALGAFGRRWNAVCDGAPALDTPADAVLWCAAKWTDDELARVYEMVTSCAATSATHGVDLWLQLDKEQRPRLTATAGEDELPLGTLGMALGADGARTIALKDFATGRTIRFAPEIIERALGKNA